MNFNLFKYPLSISIINIPIINLLSFIIIISIISITIPGCGNDDSNNPVVPETIERGDIEQLKSLGEKSPAEIKEILSASNVTLPFTLLYSVETISINYYSIDRNGNEKLVSGAVFVPRDLNNLPMVSILHGTETKNDLVASVSPLNSSEGIIALIMASLGYLVLAPDYLGFGISTEMHPYIHAESLIPCVIDLLRAGRTFCSNNEISLDGRLFLLGYSEGGFLTLATQKEIEENYQTEFKLTATAPMAGPYDLDWMTESIFQSTTYKTPAYIAYILTAYNNIYGWNRLNDIFQTPYAAKMPGLFDGSKTWGEILDQLPENLSDLINPVFISNYLNGNETDFAAAVKENTLLNWTPKAPIHFFHGDADMIVPYQNTLTAIERFTLNGATNIKLTTIPGGTHESSGPYTSIGAIQWIESL